MFSKFAFIALLAAVARCNASEGTSSFSYGVSDPKTGDVKDQHEKRVGNSVVGQYSLLEADGTKRTVEYSSHPQTGFHAVVRKDPPYGVHPPSPVGYIGAASLTHGALGYAGVNSLAYGGPNAWNPASTPAYAGSPYAGGAYGGYGAYGATANVWPSSSANGAYANGWPSNYGTTGVSPVNEWPTSTSANGIYGANGWPATAGANAWPQNYGANGAYGTNGWPQGYGGYGAAGYAGYGANSLTSGNAYSYSNQNLGW